MHPTQDRYLHRRQECYPYRTFAAPATTRPHQQEAERLTESTLSAPCLSVHACGEIGRTYFHLLLKSFRNLHAVRLVPSN
jgi:hypothetical protein